MARGSGRAARAAQVGAKGGRLARVGRVANPALTVLGAGLDYVDGRSQGEDRTRAAVGAAGSALGGWYGAGQGFTAGAGLGLATGPAAPIASPVLGLGGALIGGFGGSALGGWAADRVDSVVRGDRGGRGSRAIAQAAPQFQPQQFQPPPMAIAQVPQQQPQQFQQFQPPPRTDVQRPERGLNVSPSGWAALGVGTALTGAAVLTGRAAIARAVPRIAPHAQKAMEGIRTAGAAIAGKTAAAPSVQAVSAAAKQAAPGVRQGVATVGAAAGGAVGAVDDGLAAAAKKPGIMGKFGQVVQGLAPTQMGKTVVQEGVKVAVAIPILQRLGLGHPVVAAAVAAPVAATVGGALQQRTSRQFGTQAAWWDQLFFGGSINRTFGEKGSEYEKIESREREQNRKQDIDLLRSEVMSSGQVEAARIRSEALVEAALIRAQSGPGGANRLEEARINASAGLRNRELQEVGATTRQRIQTGGQVRVAEISQRGATERQRIQTGGQVKIADLTTGRNLQGRMYEADRRVDAQRIQTGGQIEVARTNQRGAIAVADLTTGRNLQGRMYEADTKQAIASIETGGKVRAAELDSKARIQTARSAMMGTMGAAAAGAKLSEAPKTWEEAAIRSASPTRIAYEADLARQKRDRQEMEGRMNASWAEGQARTDRFNAASRQQSAAIATAKARGDAEAKAKTSVEEEKTRREWLLRSLGL